MVKLSAKLLKNKLPLILRIICVLLLCSFSKKIFAQDAPVAVRLFENYHSKSIDIWPPFELMGGSARSQINIACTASSENGRIWLRPRVQKEYKSSQYIQSQVFAALSELSVREVKGQGVAVSANFYDPSHRNRRYHGIITLSLLRGGTIDVINEVSRRDYVAGVVASEAPKNASYEMLRAQAVLAQTLLGRQKGTNLIGDSTQSQCYLGCSLEAPLTKSAVESVWGENIYYKDLPITVYYHSTCAGGTSSGARFFHIKNRDLTYLADIPCKNCSKSPFWKPTITEISGPSFTKVFGNDLPQILESDYTGRPLTIKLSNGKTMTGYDFWISLGQHFGWDKAPGTRFKLKSGNNGNIIVESTGAGHGVGLCQWGASGLASQGKSYKQILRFYFPGCVIR